MTDSDADFFAWRALDKLNFTCGKRREQDHAMTLAGRLSVLAAYIALAFVGAIVLGVF